MKTVYVYKKFNEKIVETSELKKSYKRQKIPYQIYLIK